MGDFLAAVRVLHGEIEGFRIDVRHFHAPTLGRVEEGFLELDEFGEIGVVKRVGFPHVATDIELIEPDFPGGCALVEESTTVFTPAPRKVPPGQSSQGVWLARGIAEQFG